MGMIINLFKGLVALGVAVTVCIAVLWLILRMLTGNKGRRKRDRDGHRYLYYFMDVTLLFIRHIYVKVVLGIVVGCLCVGCAYGIMRGSGDGYTYLKTDLAVQKSVETLFEPEPAKPEREREQSRRLERLHIPERFLGAEITPEMFTYYEGCMAPIYTDGTKTGYEPQDLPDEGSEEYGLGDSKDIQEARRYRESYENYPSLATHYQYGRALIDAGMRLDRLPFPLKLDIMANGVSAMEDFLAYADRDVGTWEDPVVITTEYVSLIVGKLYLRNGRLAAGSDEGAEYVSCFLVAGYVGFKLGREQCDERDKQYARLCYYVGNAGENILMRIDKDKQADLYKIIGNEAMAGYAEALECLEKDPRHYDVEADMEKHIRSGMDTLRVLGFSAQ